MAHIDPLSDDHEALTFHPIERKETNPKDAIGTRKAALSAVPMNVLVQVGLGMMEGAAKYGRHNFRPAGVRASVYFDAGMRHKLAWWEGQDIDPDSRLHHVIKEICTLFVLADAIMAGKLVDDRPPSVGIDYEQANRLAGEILDRHADKSPRHYTIADTPSVE
jgi:hypothetical protein